jgi:GT2 family glycosyltransferase
MLYVWSRRLHANNVWPMRLAAVIVNFKTPDHTATAVRSLLASRRTFDEIIVVENGSGDGSADRLLPLIPAATLLVAGHNNGFAAGCNMGIREALGRGAGLVLLINSDAIIDPDAAGVLERAVLGDPRRGIAGPVVVKQSNPLEVESRGLSFAPESGRVTMRGYGDSVGVLPEVEEVSAVPGSAMMVKSAVFDAIGMLTEDYFWGFEDLEFCVRAAAAGFFTVVAGGARVQHGGSISIGPRSADRLYWATRNHLLVLDRCAPLPPLRGAIRRGLVLGMNLTYAVTRSPAPRGRGVLAVVRGACAYFTRARF